MMKSILMLSVCCLAIGRTLAGPEKLSLPVEQSIVKEDLEMVMIGPGLWACCPLKSRDCYGFSIGENSAKMRFNWMNALETSYSNDEAIPSRKCLYLGTGEEIGSITPDSDEVSFEARDREIMLWQSYTDKGQYIARFKLLKELGTAEGFSLNTAVNIWYRNANDDIKYAFKVDEYPESWVPAEPEPAEEGPTPGTSEGAAEEGPTPGTSEGAAEEGPAPGTSEGAAEEGPAPGTSEGAAEEGPAPGTSEGAAEEGTPQ